MVINPDFNPSYDRILELCTTCEKHECVEPILFSTNSLGIHLILPSQVHKALHTSGIILYNTTVSCQFDHMLLSTFRRRLLDIKDLSSRVDLYREKADDVTSNQ